MSSIEESWRELTEALSTAGEKLAALVADLDPVEAADGYRALLRALNNQLGRLEVDRERPELVFFNGWREKFFMDNPDFRYWVADVRDDRSYRIAGTVGDAVYQSITAYAGRGTAEAKAVGRVDSDSIDLDGDGRFEVIASRKRPETGPWLPLEDGANMIWVRHFHEDVAHDRLGRCVIEPLSAPSSPPVLDPELFAGHLRRLGRAVEIVPPVFASTMNTERAQPNRLRHWSEMAGGAAFTEPGIHYVRGSWQLQPEEALVIEGPVIPSRYWNILLYSRFLNSLDYRHRPVSRTSGTARVRNGRYRFVVAGRDPGGDHDWLDTEGRSTGLIVMRWLQPAAEVVLPDVRRCRLDELAA